MLLLLLQTHPIEAPNPDGDLADITLWDEFTNSTGQFVHYDAHDLTQRVQLAKQKHINIRSFENDDFLISIPMLYLDLLPTGLLDNQRMIDMEGSTVVRAGERWTTGTVAKDATRKNWRVLTMLCNIGTNVSSSTFFN